MRRLARGACTRRTLRHQVPAPRRRASLASWPSSPDTLIFTRAGFTSVAQGHDLSHRARVLDLPSHVTISCDRLMLTRTQRDHQGKNPGEKGNREGDIGPLSWG